MASKLGIFGAALTFVVASPSCVADAQAVTKIGWPTKDLCGEATEDARNRIMETLPDYFECGPKQGGDPASPKDGKRHSDVAVSVGKDARNDVEDILWKRIDDEEVRKCADDAAGKIAKLVMKANMVCIGGKPMLMRPSPTCPPNGGRMGVVSSNNRGF